MGHPDSFPVTSACVSKVLKTRKDGLVGESRTASCKNVDFGARGICSQTIPTARIVRILDQRQGRFDNQCGQELEPYNV